MKRSLPALLVCVNFSRIQTILPSISSDGFSTIYLLEIVESSSKPSSIELGFLEERNGTSLRLNTDSGLLS